MIYYHFILINYDYYSHVFCALCETHTVAPAVYLQRGILLLRYHDISLGRSDRRSPGMWSFWQLRPMHMLEPSDSADAIVDL